MDWSNSQALELIQLYKGHECLWNPTDDDYKNKTKKSDAWRRISDVLKMDVNEVKKKMESLLTSFRRERQKQDTSKKSGCSYDEVYVSRWFGFKSMLFLMDKFTPKQTRNSEEPNSEYVQQMANDDSANVADQEYGKNDVDELETTSSVARSPPVQKSDFIPPKRLKVIQNRRADEASRDAEAASSPVPRSPPTQKSDFFAPKRLRVIQNRRADKTFKDTIDNRQSRQSSNDSTVYGEYIASKHRKYSAHTKSVIEHLIAGILFNADMGHYEPVTESHRNQQPANVSSVTHNFIADTSPMPSPSLSDSDAQQPGYAPRQNDNSHQNTNPSSSSSHSHFSDATTTQPDAFQDTALAYLINTFKE